MLYSMCPTDFQLAPAALKPGDQSISKLFGVEPLLVAHGALPYNRNAPVEVAKGLENPKVAGAITGNALRPVLWSGFWTQRRAAVVAVPEATMDEECYAILGQNDVGLPGQVGMQPVSFAACEEELPHQ